MSWPEATGRSTAPPAPAPSPTVCLTVLVPAAVEDRLTDWLLDQAAGEVEFSVHAVAARGPLVHLAARDERVQGFAQRREFKLILARSRLQPLLPALRQLLMGVDGGYWVLPVEDLAAFDTVPAPLEAR